MSNLLKKLVLKNRKAVVYTSAAVIGTSIVGGGGYFAYSQVKQFAEKKEAVRLEQERIAEEERLKAEEEARKAERAEFLANNKIAYLTFDDGPSPVNTPKVLKVLADNNIKATFFMVGSMVENYPDLVKQIYEAGHTIANHTYSHKYSYPTAEAFLEDLNKADEKISEAIGKTYKSKYVRCPGGSFGKTLLKDTLAKNGYIDMNWTALNGDSEKGGNVSKDYALNRIKSTVGDDQYEVVLMHDIKSVTANNLQAIIDTIKAEGYVFEALTEDCTQFMK